MIYLCPFCGRSLSRKLSEGFTTCDNCERVFDSSEYHQVLAASWVARRHHVEEKFLLMHKTGLSEELADIVTEYVIDGLYCHDDFLRLLDDTFNLRQQKIA